MAEHAVWSKAVSDSAQAELNGRNIIHFPGSAEFLDSETDFFSAMAEQVRSAAVARPTSTADVSTILKTDLASRRSVYAALESHVPSLTTVGGRLSGVGVAGLLLGGGLSCLSAKYGFGADTVSAWEVVLASGQIVHAARDQEDTWDLWDALRGGSTNFGIVTAVEMACFPHPDTFRGAVAFYLPMSREATLKALVHVGSEPLPREAEPINHVIWCITHYLGIKFINTLISTTGTAKEVDLRDFVNVRGRIPLTGNLRASSHGGFAEQQNKLAPKSGGRTLDKTITVKMNINLLNALVDTWYSSVDVMRRRVSGLMCTLVFQPLPAGMIAHAVQTAPSRPSSTTFHGLDPEDGPLVMVELCMTWKKTEDDDFLSRAGSQFLVDAVKLAREMGLHHRYIFPNYAWPTDEVMNGYGEARLAALRDVARKWDPEGFFQGQFVGGFKINGPHCNSL